MFPSLIRKPSRKLGEVLLQKGVGGLWEKAAYVLSNLILFKS